MNDIKPIETIYNGYRFRSRLEARWAVFFDAAGIKYEYEPEGYQFADGTRYLPDFYLPWFKCYAEIKPASISQEDFDVALEKCKTLFEYGPDCAVLICRGDPFDDDIQIICAEEDWDHSGTILWRDKANFYEGAMFDGGDWGYSKHTICLVVGEEDAPLGLNWVHFYTSQKGREFGRRWELYGWRDNFSKCKEKARQARFEHGECG